MPVLPPARRLHGRSLAVAVAVAAVLAASLAVAWHLAGAPTGPQELAGPWSWLPMLVFGAACGLAGLLWGRLERHAQLRQATQSQQALAELADGWIWRTDARHQVVAWRPPPGAPASAWTEQLPTGQALHSQFEVADPRPSPGALLARLDAQAMIASLRVQRRGSQPPTHWQLRALPQYDVRGTFAGYVGTLVPVDQAEQQRFDAALLQRLWGELEMPAFVLRPHEAAAPGSGWDLAALSPDAARLLGPRGQQRDWQQAQLALPGDVQSALKKLPEGESRVAGPWKVDLLPVASDGDTLGRLLLLRSTQAAAAETATSQADQDSFVYSVSHDLRAPLRVVDGFARILKEDYGRFLDRIGNDHLDRVLAASARMNSMIDALLALSRLQSQPLARKPVDLSQLATYIMEDLRSQAPERQATITIEPGLVVNGDPTLLRIAMENLLGNAWKYSGQCEQTVIEFRSEEQAEHGRVFVVADRGAGFDMRFADRLFGVFQRLHSPKDFQGTGVGLASVRRILRRHGGDIWAESEVGKGARFYFTLG
ncbi:hypothetical protein KGA65_15540 [Ideonella sp. B7]|uniref:sensor histidine kinase n=1 Tax=Ideonella benzenivorans TaxID=2831643 RepID=UPI001CEC442D|nr:ATP-binding protein [Ideonella benzenivorans]MCA6217946.1 hypothetical protein [Ideonella benzenivorans]